MASNQGEVRRNLRIALSKWRSSISETPTMDAIREAAKNFAQMFNYSDDLEEIIHEVMIMHDSRMGSGVSLVDVEAPHDEEWVSKKDIDWVYSDAYYDYLEDEGFHSNIVSSMSQISRKILGHLQDPLSEGSWDRRGLVIGHVQSGKTANYLGLVARAADAGYKFIVVIAGIHNNLRKQTQERVDEGFVGRSSNPDDRRSAGVGLMKPDYPHPVTLTNIYDDFKKVTANQSGWKLNDFSKPIVLVIKKNVRTLDSLFRWLKDMNAKNTEGGDRISDVPMLMIDDEADHASINTNVDDLDPTRTNEMIRKILGLFDKSCFVGYTATPFANIFINPDSYDEEVREELFPSDFIYCLDAPSTYFGPDAVFGDESDASYVVPIVDAEDYLPFSHKKDFRVHELPPSLYRAINQFIVARAIRNLRGQQYEHASMMINASRFVSVQNQIRDFVNIYEEKLRQAIKANYRMPEQVSSRNSYMKDIKAVFDTEFLECDYSWVQVKRQLYGVFDTLRIFTINSESDEMLDYKKYDKDGIGLTAIAIGGLSLSRGLTIEGLCVSYMYRNTRMYDTLMQMGRWFGYRPGYEDVCRIHLSPDSISWYGHISDASEELRQQIKRMSRYNLSPRKFGLYVKAHPDRLLITAVNKMRTGETIKMEANYSGRIVESYILPADKDINQYNENLISEYWGSGFGLGLDKVGRVEPDKKGWTIANVETEQVEEFLRHFKVHESFEGIKGAALDYLVKISSDYPRSDVALVSIGAPRHGEDEGAFKLGVQERRGAKYLNGFGAWRVSKDRVASRGDEKLGLTEVQRDDAKKLVDGDQGVSDTHYREVRNRPLLMLHALDLGPDLEEGKDAERRVPAFGLSFPHGDYSMEITVVVNRIWAEIMNGPPSDGPGDDEYNDD